MKKIISVGLFSLFALVNAQTKIVAHRGYWQTNPATTENSIQSLQNAAHIKVYGSEFDVCMTKDGVLVVNHDEHHAAQEISETNFEDLRKIKLSNGENFPTLEEYLQEGKRQKVKLVVELKPAKTKELEDELVTKSLAMINKIGVLKQCDFISFSKNICLELKKQNPNTKVQYLNGDLSPKEIKELGLDGIDYHYKVLLLKNPTWIKEAKALGLITNTWTVNDAETFKKLKEQGIDFVTTNIPEELKKL